VRPAVGLEVSAAQPTLRLVTPLLAAVQACCWRCCGPSWPACQQPALRSVVQRAWLSGACSSQPSVRHLRCPTNVKQGIAPARTSNTEGRDQAPDLQLPLSWGALGAARLGRARIVGLRVVRRRQLLIAGGAALIGAAAQKLHTSIARALACLRRHCSARRRLFALQC
jgi:hypothetical protein